MKKWLCLFLTLTILLAGCGSKSASYDMAEGGYMEAPSATMAPSVNGSMDMESAAANKNVSDGRKWIVTASMSAETEDLEQTLSDVEAQVKAIGGYIQDQSINNGGMYSGRYNRHAYLTIRIPVTETESFMLSVSKLSNVTSSSKSMEDVTLRYVATESRMNALKTEEARLLELMEKAEELSDLLMIESRLTEVRYELENITTQLRTLVNLVDYATVDLSVSEVKVFTPVEEPTFWQRITRGFSQNLADLGDTIEDVTVWFVTSLPTLLVLGLLLWGGIAVVVKIRRKRKVKKAPKQEKNEAE